MEKQKNLFLHWINIYHSEILTNLPAIEGLQANLAMYTELTVILNLDRFTVDSILTYGSMAIIPLLVISVQYQKTGFGFYNSLNICLDCGYFHISSGIICVELFISLWFISLLWQFMPHFLVKCSKHVQLLFYSGEKWTH